MVKTSVAFSMLSCPTYFQSQGTNCTLCHSHVSFVFALWKLSYCQILLVLRDKSIIFRILSCFHPT